MTRTKEENSRRGRNNRAKGQNGELVGRRFLESHGIPAQKLDHLEGDIVILAPLWKKPCFHKVEVKWRKRVGATLVREELEKSQIVMCKEPYREWQFAMRASFLFSIVCPSDVKCEYTFDDPVVYLSAKDFFAIWKGVGLDETKPK